MFVLLHRHGATEERPGGIHVEVSLSASEWSFVLGAIGAGGCENLRPSEQSSHASMHNGNARTGKGLFHNTLHIRSTYIHCAYTTAREWRVELQHAPGWEKLVQCASGMLMEGFCFGNTFCTG
jgi:hypothetical protein